MCYCANSGELVQVFVEGRVISDNRPLWEGWVFGPFGEKRAARDKKRNQGTSAPINPIWEIAGDG
jgi:hypothetical protein